LVDRETRFKANIKRYKAIAIDTQPFIYHLQENQTYLPLTRAIFEAVEKGETKASTSAITLMEILVKPKSDGNTRAVEEYKFALRTFPNLKLRPVDEAVAERAAEIRAQYNLRPPDAIQISSAMLEDAQAFFTNDGKLKSVKEIKVIVLKEVLSRPRTG
jgi:predicted nucleic acid-binding protein